MRLRLTILLCVLQSLSAGCSDKRLVNSIKSGDAQLSDKLLAEGVDVNARGTGGETSLHAAIMAGNKDIYSKLLTKGADPNICDVRGTSVVHLAANQNDVFWQHEALRNGGNPNQPNTGNRYYPNSTPIFYAISKRLTPNVVELIAAGADLNHADQHGMRPLSEAMEMGLYDAVIKLIEARADLSLVQIHESLQFDELYEDRDGPSENRIKDENQKRSFLELQALLIEKGYLKRK